MVRISVRNCVAVVLLIGLIAGVGGWVAASDSAATKQLMSVDEAWSKASTERNVDAVASYYAEDAHVYPPNEPVVVGRAAAKESWAQILKDESTKLSWKPNSAGVEGSMGYTAGTYQMTFKGADGKDMSDTGKYLCVWKKDKDGKWKAIHDMWNSDTK